MNIFARLSDEHITLLPLVIEMQAAAEAQDNKALVATIVEGRVALSDELDAHIDLEDDVAFAAIAKRVGEEVVTPFRAEHVEICSLRDALLAQAAVGHVSIGLCLQFCDLIQAHMRREDMMLFPSALDRAM